MTTLSARFDDAFKYAHEVHAAQTRKGSASPYIGHLMGVASIVLDDGGGEDEAIGALLHDAAEDGGGRERLEDIRARFGDAVARIAPTPGRRRSRPGPTVSARMSSTRERCRRAACGWPPPTRSTTPTRSCAICATLAMRCGPGSMRPPMTSSRITRDLSGRCARPGAVGSWKSWTGS
jgi:hypothetical protein